MSKAQTRVSELMNGNGVGDPGRLRVTARLALGRIGEDTSTFFGHYVGGMVCLTGGPRKTRRLCWTFL